MIPASPVVPPKLSVLSDLGRLKEAFGFTLNPELDQELQKIVEKLKAESGYPIALVSIILKNIQFFKAHVGLPNDLAISRATDRCSSFCQYVVSEKKPFHIPDTSLFPELPPDLIQRYNIRAYYGVPVTVRGQVVGSLCIIDSVAHTADEKTQKLMNEMAVRVSHRLEIMGERTRSTSQALNLAFGPAIGEVRNALTPVCLYAERSGQLIQELIPTLELVTAFERGDVNVEELKRGLGALNVTQETVKRFRSWERSLDQSLSRLIQGIRGMEKAMKPNESHETNLMESISVAETLALHQTKLIGGVRWSRPQKTLPLVKIQASELSLLLASALNLMTESVIHHLADIDAKSTGLQGEIVASGIEGAIPALWTEVRIQAPGVGDEEVIDIASVLAFHQEGNSKAEVLARGSTLVIRLPESPPPLS